MPDWDIFGMMTVSRQRKAGGLNIVGQFLLQITSRFNRGGLMWNCGNGQHQHDTIRDGPVTDSEGNLKHRFYGEGWGKLRHAKGIPEFSKGLQHVEQ